MTQKGLPTSPQPFVRVWCECCMVTRLDEQGKCSKCERESATADAAIAPIPTEPSTEPPKS